LAVNLRTWIVNECTNRQQSASGLRHLMHRLDGNRPIAHIARLESDRNVAGLIHELENQLGRGYGAARLHAVLALERLGDPRAAQYIAPLTQDGSPLVRAASLSALRTLEHQGAASLMLEALTDVAPIVRETAAEQLEKIGATAAIPHLRDIVATDDDRNVRVSAAEALLRLGESDIAPQIPALVSALPWWKRRGVHWKKLLEDARASIETN
jgi:HEAT repeat protein